MTRSLGNDTVLSGYRLVRSLGRGGCGEVWEAEGPGGGRKAVKIVPMYSTPGLLRGREFEGLHRVRNIHHPHLIAVEHFEITDTDLVVVMELAEKSLGDRFQECVAEGLPGIPRAELVEYLAQAAEALDYLSRHHGLQHLDVKPENLLLAGGRLKVADFGLVHRQDAILAQSAIAITPPYAPPELFDGQIASSADQYGLAVTYQDLLTGTRPYDASEIRDLVYQHLRGRPDLTRLPAGDRGVISRAIHRNPVERFASCSEFVESLRRTIVFGTSASRAATVPVIPPPSGPAAGAEGRAPDTTPAVRASAPTDSLKPDAPSAGADEGVRATFVAYLPQDLYAHKLRAFVDAMHAEIVTCRGDKVVLRLRKRGWCFFRERHNVFVEIDSFCKVLNSDSRIVDVKVWARGGQLRDFGLGRRAMMLVACLKSFFMASGRSGMIGIGDAAIREAILG